MLLGLEDIVVLSQEGIEWEQAIDGCLYLIEVGQVVMEDVDLLGESLSLVEDLIEVELFEVLLLLVEVSAVLVDILIDDFD